MIIVIAPFPSISYEYDVTELIPNNIVDTVSTSYYVYSKGVHSAKTIKILQEEPLLLSALGGISGKTIKHHLDKSKIKSDVIWTNAITPQKIKLHDIKLENDYIIQTSSSFPTKKDLTKLTSRFEEHIKKVKTVVISDEMGKLCSSDTDIMYKSWIEISNRNNVKVILSTDSLSILKHTSSSTPYALVFTEEQLIELGYDSSCYRDIARALLPLIKTGIHYISVYLRNKSALIISKNSCYLIECNPSTSIECNNYFGGVFIGSFAIGINRKYEIERIGKLSLSCAVSASGNIDKPIINRKDIEYLFKRTKVSKLSI